MQPGGRLEPPSSASEAGVRWDTYDSPGCWDEMLAGGRPRKASAGIMRYLTSLGDELLERQRAAELAIQAMGITFTVSSQAGDIDRAWPFDVIPRVISTQEWAQITAGLVQRLLALNLFIDDLYRNTKVVAVPC